MSSQTYLLIWSSISCVSGLLIGGLIMWLFMKIRNPSKNENLKLQIVELQTELKAEKEKLSWLENTQQQMEETFEALSGRVLQTSSEQLIQRTKEQTENIINQARGDWITQKTEIQGLVEPLKDNLKDLDKQVRAMEEKREGAYKGLEEQLRQLSNSQSDLRTTTLTLTQALKSPTVRGRWGELQLRRVVEMSGMVRHVSFDEQPGGEGGRPDVIIYLPNSGILPIDSKVPLESYMAAMEGCDENTRQSYLGQHAKAVKSRIRELSQRNYWDQFEITPEFVIMFIPNEACLGAAFDIDPTLFDYAIELKVLITTPVTLLALLKAVAYGWQQNQLTENARNIASQGQELYKRFEKFVDHLIELHKSINNTVNIYNRAIGSFETRVLPASRRLQELGLSQNELESPNTIDVHAKLPSSLDEVT